MVDSIRYVREWLKAVLVAKVIESDSTGTKFYLPKGRGKGLLGPWNSVFFNFYPSLAGVYGEIVDCFNPTGPSGTVAIAKLLLFMNYENLLLIY